MHLRFGPAAGQADRDMDIPVGDMPEERDMTGSDAGGAESYAKVSFGPVAVWCRSFDSIICSKGDELWAQEERMNFAKY